MVSIGEYIGLNNLEYSYHIACKRKNGNLVFGTTDGAVEFSAQQETDIQLESKLIITDFKLFYNSVKAKDEGSPLKQAINETFLMRGKTNISTELFLLCLFFRQFPPSALDFLCL